MEEEVKKEEKSNKWLYIIIIAVVAVALIGWIFRMSFSSLTGGDIKMNIDGSTTYSNDEAKVTVGGNKLPDNWPQDVPKYPNAAIVYSGSSNPETGEEGAAIAFTTSDKIAVVADFYKKELASNGWKIEQTANIGPSTVISAKKDTRTLGVSIVDGGNGQVSVTVGIGVPKQQ